MIMEVLDFENPDCICIQEVLDAGKNSVRASLKRIGYDMSNGSKSATKDRSYVAWKTKDYHVIDERTIDDIDVDAVRLQSDTNKTISLLSYHGLYGAEHSGGRLRELRSIMHLTDHRNPDSINASEDDVYLAGDFNALPNEIGMRAMRGLEGDAVYWTDAFDASPRVRGLEDGTSIRTGLGLITALNNDVLIPASLPKRRIDYILHQGWSYGKPGGFTNLKGVNRDDLSDHVILIAETL
jgi:endonuclease/exonuclease/phosphatase family metal-dependent hydrolase